MDFERPQSIGAIEPADEHPAAGALDNAQLADALERVSELLLAQDASPFRVRAYRAAAATLRELPRSAASILADEGTAGLERLPHVGPVIARAIAELLQRGRLGLLERLQGELCPERLFASLPSLGPSLARRIHEQLGVDTLEELELAAHDGRLARVPGFGPRRVRALRELLGSLLRRKRFAAPSAAVTSHPPQPHPPAPAVDALLACDARYRERAQAGELPRIAPKRWNPEHAAWLPVMHETAGEFQLTALYSNTALAHRLGTTHDWVVIFHEGPGGEGQHTVVTERRGPLAGRRVVRGRELECAELYARR